MLQLMFASLTTLFRIIIVHQVANIDASLSTIQFLVGLHCKFFSSFDDVKYHNSALWLNLFAMVVRITLFDWVDLMGFERHNVHDGVCLY